MSIIIANCFVPHCILWISYLLCLPCELRNLKDFASGERKTHTKATRIFTGKGENR